MNTFKTKNILLATITTMLFSCAQSESSKVKETCNRFIKGRIDLRRNDSTQIKAVTEDSLYRLLMLHHNYAQMLDAPIVNADLRMSVKSVEITEDCASCEMSSIEYYKIHLCKDGEDWKVQGENSIYPTAERLAKARQKIIDHKKKHVQKPITDSILKAVNIFLPTVKDYFLTENQEPLKTICDDATVNFIKQFYAYAKERTGLEVLHTEMSQPNFMVGDYFNDNGLIEFRFYNEETTIVFTKNDQNEMMVSGFNGTMSKDIDRIYMKDHYLELLRAMKLTRQPRYRSEDLK
ncbi:hypothetical protein [Psychroserpens sp. Hel_I_66]|uniref:hypothetical protein n=1 Tax=Psychroserpens sp. Hel_I_66 TaxID=1250004 RepID=UPI00064658E8|nr:hypothetical protein [Psychroserpens sp. Hel_I_66]